MYSPLLTIQMGLSTLRNRKSSFTSLPNATRVSRHHPSSSSALPGSNSSIFRETPTASSTFYQPSDMYQPPLTSPSQAHMQQIGFDFGPTSAPPTGNNHKNSFAMDPYASSPLPTSFPISAKPQQQPHVNGFVGSGSSFSMSSQTPYGPHIPTNTVSMGGGAANSNSNVGSNGNSAPQEDISTIFVVGFPDDMQEREFQNMFTFSPGFEAATLKIPNKEYTSYGSLAGAGAGSSAARAVSSFNYSGSNDPYNLVTVNQGGVVVDGGRDGTMASWPAVPIDDAGGAAGNNHFYNGPGMQSSGAAGAPGANMPPRKQIIGFAKFRTREEALAARDTLQGRRVDIEKGAVLKAEMAKKNLHTKRGVGPVVGGGTLGPGVGGGAGMGGLGAAVQGFIGAGGAGITSLQPFGLGGPELYGMSGNEVLSARDREIAALGAMGLASGGNSSARLWQENAGDEERRRDGAINAMGLGHVSTRRALEEEEQKERKRKDKDGLRLRAGSAYEQAFHYGGVSLPTSGIMPPIENGVGNGFAHSGLAHPMPSMALNQLPEENTPVVGPWDHVQRTGPNRPPSSSRRSSSPPHPSNMSNTTSQSNSSNPQSDGRSSPSKDQQASQPQSDSESRSSSVTGHAGPRKAAAGSNVVDNEISRAVNNLAVSTNHGNTSPELPSPESGVSSGGSTRNGVDQNPPINTLYVGNLPISPPPPHCPQDILEESLRELFRSRPGFRRLSFKQKSSGPMCFVEFEDVSAASRTISELYGHTLNGLVKGGGIRLSYSKNPLGVRTPTSATSGGSALQQQQPPPGHMGPGAAFVSHGQGSAQQQNSHNFMVSAQPPRFSGSASSSTFGSFPGTTNGGAFMFGHNINSINMNSIHSHTPGYRLTSTSNDMPPSSGFSPFDVGSPAVHRGSIPDQNSSDPQHHQQHYISRTLSPHTVEAARAG
ncbi:hypothetical protein K435DRAFT_814699 [Dendrothele bispora CBS 962.96]|uniref:RRM domain-containing protein n=1 Tax=Dendrothele bispora (strain CBS 962.96) TaxID=1314807 RepID=A0A4S8MZK8_DENBC|nr:hypothetical protein K435DRAFT_814699 [Dendrothele bispora CBS 962.96]